MSFWESGFGGNLYYALGLLFIYSFLGVVAETIYCWAVEHKGIIESRTGLLYLPFNLLYGVGGVVVTLLLIDNFDNPLIVFALGLVVCTTLEYLTSFVMEKGFKSVFWDYSDKPFNLHGRICLQFAIYWGLLSLFLIYVLDVINLLLLQAMPREVGLPILAVLVVVTLGSVVLTLATFHRTGQKVAWLKARQAGADARLPDSAIGRLVDRLVPDGVLVNTFPRMSVVEEYQELSGHRRRVIRFDGHLGRISELRAEARARADRLHPANTS